MPVPTPELEDIPPLRQLGKLFFKLNQQILFFGKIFERLGGIMAHRDKTVFGRMSKGKLWVRLLGTMVFPRREHEDGDIGGVDPADAAGLRQVSQVKLIEL
jgi:hypothetical protein